MKLVFESTVRVLREIAKNYADDGYSGEEFYMRAYHHLLQSITSLKWAIYDDVLSAANTKYESINWELIAWALEGAPSLMDLDEVAASATKTADQLEKITLPSKKKKKKRK